MSARFDASGEQDRREQVGAMWRVFGGTALAFLILLVVALVVRPDMMQAAADMVMSVMH